uniref:Putative kunitz n=1 Tax=Ixodes ricinus TaxID=34613 RepID=A0A6B0U6S9_IXORI
MLIIFVVSLVIMASMGGDTSGKKKQRKGRPLKCYLPPDEGPCRARIPSYYFNNKTCVEFMYGGCEGNANNFETVEQCRKECKDKRGKKTTPKLKAL